MSQLNVHWAEFTETLSQQQFISLSRDVYTSIYKTDENMSDYVY